MSKYDRTIETVHWDCLVWVWQHEVTVLSVTCVYIGCAYITCNEEQLSSDIVYRVQPGYYVIVLQPFLPCVLRTFARTSHCFHNIIFQLSNCSHYWLLLHAKLCNKKATENVSLVYRQQERKKLVAIFGIFFELICLFNE